MKPVLIIDYGVGNLASLNNAFKALGIPVEVSSAPEKIVQADKIVLPGVGAFAPAIRRLRQRKLDQVISDRVSAGARLLGICLGMQLLFTVSEEMGEWSGLGLVPGRVKRFENVAKIPHMGWNQVEIKRPSPLFQGIADRQHFYFVHSFYCSPDDPACELASSEYGGEFCAAVASGNIWGVQFHPEKSHRNGLRLLNNFAHL